MNVPPDLVAALARAGQGHVLAFWPDLDESARRAFVAQLEEVDWRLLGDLERLVHDRRLGPTSGAAAPLSADAATPPCLTLGAAANPIPPADAIRRGRLELERGGVGAILVAGGQGTRLGCRGPKGLHPIGPVTRATLFHVLLGKLAAVRARHGRDVPLAIMTSSATDTETRAFLEEHAWCGLDPRRVFVFRQHDLPALDDETGRLLLDAPGRLAVAPDGHGGMLVALAESGGLDWFGRQGVEHVVSFQVDNPLAMPLAPEFLGYQVAASLRASGAGSAAAGRRSADACRYTFARLPCGPPGRSRWGVRPRGPPPQQGERAAAPGRAGGRRRVRRFHERAVAHERHSLGGDRPGAPRGPGRRAGG